MASKFDKAKVTQTIKDVAQTSNEKANLVTIRYYNDEDLIDYPRNNEDISSTEDIEKSIDEQGFTDPIEITDFGMEEGKYTILSGHRRRMAGRKKGMKTFPCIVRHFRSELEVYNYVLYSNSQRDSAKDPMLYARRYAMHEQYLIESGFKGSKADLVKEIADRLNVKIAQATRYNQMNKVIPPICDMVSNFTVGLSSITDSGLYTHTPEEQEEMLAIIEECIKSGIEVTRPIVKKIVTGWREGKRSWSEITENTDTPTADAPTDDTPTADAPTDDTPTADTPTADTPTADTPTDDAPTADTPTADAPTADAPTDDTLTADAPTDDIPEDNTSTEKLPLTDEEKKLLAGERIIKHLATLENAFTQNFYKFKDSEQAGATIKLIANTAMIMFSEMEDISNQYALESIFQKSMLELKKEIECYKEEK